MNPIHIEIPAEVRGSVLKFREFLYSQGNYFWSGGERELEALNRLMTRQVVQRGGARITLADFLAVQQGVPGTIEKLAVTHSDFRMSSDFWIGCVAGIVRCGPRTVGPNISIKIKPDSLATIKRKAKMYDRVASTIRMMHNELNRSALSK